jgi:hypothetical protein
VKNHAFRLAETSGRGQQALYFQAVNSSQNKIKNVVTGNFARHAVTHPPNNAPNKHDVLSLGKTA